MLQLDRITRIFLVSFSRHALTADPQGMPGHSGQQMGREASIWSARSERNVRDYRRKSVEHIFRVEIKEAEGNDRDGR